MAEGAPKTAQDRLTERGNGIGKFNAGGRTLGTGGDREFRRESDGWYARKRSQTTKDRQAVTAAGGDAKSTAASKPETEFKLAIKSTKFEDSRQFDKTKESSTSAAGTVETSTRVLGTSVEGSLEANLSAKDGIKVEIGAGAKGTLFEGKLVYTAPAAQFTMMQEDMQAVVGAELSSEVAATLEGKAEVAAKSTGKGVELGLKAGATAFAGIKSGIKLFGKLQWRAKGEGNYADVAEIGLGADGYAGAAAAAQAQATLTPRIRANVYWGAAVGIGVGVKGSIDIGATEAAKLGVILMSRGAKAALDGLEEYGPIIVDWLKNKGGRAYGDSGLEDLVNMLDGWLSDDDKARAVLPKIYMQMSPKGRASLIDRMLAGSCTDADEDAVVNIVRESGAKGDLQAVLAAVDGGTSQILWKLDGMQDGQMRALMSYYGAK